MTKNELQQLFVNKFLFEPASYELLFELSNVIAQYLSSNEENILYLLTDSNYDEKNKIDQIKLATLSKKEAYSTLNNLAHNSYSWILRLYAIPLNKTPADLNDYLIETR